MKKIGKIVLIIIYFISSCQNGENNSFSNNSKRLKEFNVEINGKKYHYFEDDQGVQTGPFSIEYFNKEFSKGFLRNGRRDSVYHLYGEKGFLKISTYYIDGLENGYRYEYSDLGNIGVSYFLENDSVKIRNVLYYLTKNSDINLGYEKKTYYFKDSNWVYSGSLILDTNFNVLQSDSFSGQKSTYYNIENKTDSNGLIIISEKTLIRIKIFKLEENSIVNVKLGESTKLAQPITNIKKYQIDSSGLVDYIINQKIKGWHFVRGEFEEIISDGQKRSVPIYFNYYVP